MSCFGTHAAGMWRKTLPADSAWVSFAATEPTERPVSFAHFFRRDWACPAALSFAYLAAIFRQRGHRVEYGLDRVPPKADVYVFNPALATLDLERQAMAAALEQRPTPVVLVVGAVARWLPAALARLAGHDGRRRSGAVALETRRGACGRIATCERRPGRRSRRIAATRLGTARSAAISHRLRLLEIPQRVHRAKPRLHAEMRLLPLYCRWRRHPLSRARGRRRRNAPRDEEVRLSVVQVPRSVVRSRPPPHARACRPHRSA